MPVTRTRPRVRAPTGPVSDQPPSAAPDLLSLIAQLAALPADQRAALARLLTASTAADAPAGPTLDDSLPPALERTTRTAHGAKGEAP